MYVYIYMGTKGGQSVSKLELNHHSIMNRNKLLNISDAQSLLLVYESTAQGPSILMSRFSIFVRSFVL